jgi:hypothetical protein
MLKKISTASTLESTQSSSFRNEVVTLFDFDQYLGADAPSDCVETAGSDGTVAQREVSSLSIDKGKGND